jgi:hypothetical protein
MAAGKIGGGAAETQDETDESSGFEIPVANFKSNKLSQIDRKKRQEDLKGIVESGNDLIDTKDAIRLPNALAQVSMKLTTDPNAPTQQMMMSPTSFLSGAGSPRL